MTTSDYKTRTLIDLSTEAPALKFGSKIDYAHMLKLADRKNVADVVNWLQQGKLNVYLTAGVLDSNLRGEGRQYGDVDLLAVGTPIDLLEITEQLRYISSIETRIQRGIDQSAGIKTKLPFEQGRTQFDVTKVHKRKQVKDMKEGLKETYLSIQPSTRWSIQAVGPIWNYLFSSEIDLVLATHEQVDEGIRDARGQKHIIDPINLHYGALDEFLNGKKPKTLDPEHPDEE